MKPSINYLDKSDRTAKAEGRPRLNESSQDEDEEEDTTKAEDVQKVGVKFMRESERATSGCFCSSHSEFVPG